MGHKSDCALHNAPALPVGPCDCGYGSTLDLVVDLQNLVTDALMESPAVTKGLAVIHLRDDILDAVLRRLKSDVSEGMVATGEAERADGAGVRVTFQNMIGDLVAALERERR